MIINLSQIEAIGPFVPFNLTDAGIFANDDAEDYMIGKFDLGLLISNNGEDNLTNSIFCVPSDSCANDCYDMLKPRGLNFVPQTYMILLKSGKIILLTEDEYDDICNVMQFDNNYSNIDYKYSKFS